MNILASSLKSKSKQQVLENLHNIRNGFSRDILRHMALALCKSHEPDALVGLQQ